MCSFAIRTEDRRIYSVYAKPPVVPVRDWSRNVHFTLLCWTTWSPAGPTVSGDWKIFGIQDLTGGCRSLKAGHSLVLSPNPSRSGESLPCAPAATDMMSHHDGQKLSQCKPLLIRVASVTYFLISAVKQCSKRKPDVKSTNSQSPVLL